MIDLFEAFKDFVSKKKKAFKDKLTNKHPVHLDLSAESAAI
jgi:hypothetical protein